MLQTGSLLVRISLADIRTGPDAAIFSSYNRRVLVGDHHNGFVHGGMAVISAAKILDHFGGDHSGGRVGHLVSLGTDSPRWD